MDRYVARKQIVKDLKELDLLERIDDHKLMVPRGDRSNAVVEPYLTDQWYVDLTTETQEDGRPGGKQLITTPSIDAVKNGSIKFVPENWSKTYYQWLDNIEDWCISRQIWWGHRIPAWYDDNGKVYVAQTESLVREKYKLADDLPLHQDEDVLDTWFSSGLWPFSTLGWPEQTDALKTWYPTSVLVTGFDIIFFWVARMTMMAGKFTDQMPFEDVYIHGLVLDEKGQKMSKSKNNGIDPLLMIEKYGADALRYTLITKVVGAGQNISFDYDRKKQESSSVETSRNFANKLWNASRFVMMNLKGKTPQALGKPDISSLELVDQWLLSRFYQTVKQTKANIESYSLGEAAKGLYEFIWNDFCDWYIELVKTRLWQDETSASRQVAQQTLGYVLEGILKLLHPFMPHITEEIWQTLTQAEGKQALAIQAYPEVAADLINSELETSFDLLFNTISTIRNLRAESVIKPGSKIKVILQTENQQESDILNSTQNYIQDIAKVSALIITSTLAEDPGQVVAGVTGTVQVLIPLTGLVDVVALQSKLQKKLDKIEKDTKSLMGRLNNPGFVNKAPDSVIQGAKADLAEAKKQAEILRERLDRLK